MKRLPLLLFLIGFLLFPSVTRAEELSGMVNLKVDTDYLLWQPDVSIFKNYSSSQSTSFGGLPIKPLPEQEAIIQPYLTVEEREGIDPSAIEAYLRDNLSDEIFRERMDVTIDRDVEGNITFDGIGLSGRILDEKKAAEMITYAIENNIAYVNLPIIRDEPIVTVKDQELIDMGIEKVIGVGYSNYGNSSYSRITNIEVGINSFNGLLVGPNEEVSAVEVLGPVEAWQGYVPELVILSDRTVPEYGGGLCQVTSTGYRAALAAGFTITERRNHSYLVNKYHPAGLDATVYIPSPDVKFINESPGHLLIQTDTIGSDVYYVFYGTPNGREASLLGPFIDQYGGSGPTRHEYTTELPPGVRRVIQQPTTSATIRWYSHVKFSKEEAEEKGVFGFVDEIYSKYQGRGLFIQEGIAAGGGGSEEAAGDGSE